MMTTRSNLHNPRLTLLMFAVLVKRLGGKAEITQADIDQVAYCKMPEEGREDGSIEFRLIEQRTTF